MKRMSLVFLMTCFLVAVGCDRHPKPNISESSSMPARAKVVSKTNTPEAAEISRVLEADNYLSELRLAAEQSIGKDALHEGGAESVERTHAENLRKISLDGVPDEFRDAYVTHIQAWQERDHVAINTTWMEVLATAQRHGVVWDD